MKTNHKICTINKDNFIQKQMHFSMNDFCTSDVSNSLPCSYIMKLRRSNFKTPKVQTNTQMHDKNKYTFKGYHEGPCHKSSELLNHF